MQAAGIKRVHLYGDLADLFGDVLEIVGHSPAKVFQIIEANFPGQFMNRLRQGEFFIWYGDEFDTDKPVNDAEAILMGTSQEDLHIAPVLEGESKRKGGVMAVLGAIVVGAAIVLSGGTLAAPMASLAAMQGTLAGTVAQLGFGLVLSGVAQMIAPMPKFETQPNEDKRESYIFSGPTNTEYEGGAIPLLYGAPYTGSVVVSGSIQIEQIEIET